MVCVVCEHRPARGGVYCPQCEKKIAAQKSSKRRAVKYVHYHGNVVAFYQVGKGRYKPEYHGMSLAGIPQSKLIDLDVFCKGYSREQVKKLKACVQSLTVAA